jgi:hypothetical protein
LWFVSGPLLSSKIPGSTARKAKKFGEKGEGTKDCRKESIFTMAAGNQKSYDNRWRKD